MKESRLIELLGSFSRSELSELGKFLHSPFVKSRRNLSPLLEYLNAQHPDFRQSGVEKKKVFAKLFPGEEYNEKKIVNLMSDLTGEAESFIRHKSLDEDEIDSLLYLSKGYYNKKLIAHSMRVLNMIGKKLNPGFSPSKDHFSKLRKTELLRGAYFAEKSDFNGLIESRLSYFEASSVQFIFDFIQTMSSLEAISETYGKDLNNKFIESVIRNFNIDKVFDEMGDVGFRYRHLIALQYYSLKTVTEPGEKKYYYLLRDEFYRNLSGLDREEKYILFNHLAGYCTTEVSRKNELFYQEALDVYKKMLENKAYSYSDNEYMQVITYRNIIYFCNTVKDIVWFGHFIENYTNALSPEYRTDMKNFALGNLHFLKEEYELSLTHISQIGHEFFLFKSDLRNILLKIYYELDYFEQAYSMIDSYKHFLSTTKEISNEYKEYYSRFVKRYLQLLKLKEGKTGIDAGMIAAQLEKETKIVNRNWLLEKAGELEKQS